MGDYADCWTACDSRCGYSVEHANVDLHMVLRPRLHEMLATDWRDTAALPRSFKVLRHDEM